MTREEKALHAIIDIETVVENFEHMEPAVFQKYLLKHRLFRSLCYWLRCLANITEEMIKEASVNGDLNPDVDDGEDYE